MAGIEHMVATLLAAQILYKITTPATAGATNPVVLFLHQSIMLLANPLSISNLAISVLHAFTLRLLWQRHGHARRP